MNCKVCGQVNCGTWCSNGKLEQMGLRTFKDLPSPRMPNPLNLGNGALEQERILSSQEDPLIKTLGTARKRIPVLPVPSLKRMARNPFKDPEATFQPLPFVYAKEPEWKSWPRNSLATSCDTLTGLPNWPACLGQSETIKRQFFGSMDRQEVAKVTKLATWLLQHTGRWDLPNGGMDTTAMKTSSLMTIAEICVHLLSCLDYLTAIPCASNSKAGLAILWPREFLSLHQNLREILGKVEQKRICSSCLDELRPSSTFLEQQDRKVEQPRNLEQEARNLEFRQEIQEPWFNPRFLEKQPRSEDEDLELAEILESIRKCDEEETKEIEDYWLRLDEDYSREEELRKQDENELQEIERLAKWNFDCDNSYW